MGRYIPKPKIQPTQVKTAVNVEGDTTIDSDFLLNTDQHIASIEHLFNLLDLVESLNDDQINSQTNVFVQFSLESLGWVAPPASPSLGKYFLKAMIKDFIIKKLKENEQLIYHHNRRLFSWLSDKSGQTKTLQNKIDVLKNKTFGKNDALVSGIFLNKLIVDGEVPNVNKLMAVLNYENTIANEFINDRESNALYEFTDGMVTSLTRDLTKKDIAKPSKWWGVLGFLVQSFSPYGELLPVYRAVVGEVKAKQAVEGMRKSTYSDDIPDIFKLYPSIANVKASPPDDGYESMESKPLFDNAVLTITRNIRQQRMDVSDKANRLVGHSAYTGKYGVSLRTNSVKIKNIEFSSLSQSEAQTILKVCAGLIHLSNGYLKDGKARSERLMNAYKNIEDKLEYVMKNGSIFYRNSAGVKALTAGMLNITRYQWNSVYKAQMAYINHLYDVVEALLTYVEKSSK